MIPAEEAVGVDVDLQKDVFKDDQTLREGADDWRAVAVEKWTGASVRMEQRRQMVCDARELSSSGRG